MSIIKIKTHAFIFLSVFTRNVSLHSLRDIQGYDLGEIVTFFTDLQSLHM